MTTATTRRKELPLGGKQSQLEKITVLVRCENGELLIMYKWLGRSCNMIPSKEQ